MNRFLAEYWPQGDDGELDRAAGAFDTAQRAVQSLLDDAQGCVDGLLGSNLSPALTGFTAVWSTVSGALTRIAGACGSLAAACRGFAASIRAMHTRLEEIGAAVGIVTGAGIVLTIFSFGLSDVAAGSIDAAIAGDAAVALSEFTVEVSTGVDAAIEAEFGPLLEAAAADLPEIDAVDAELEQTVTQIERVEVREPAGARAGGGGDRGGGGGGRGGGGGGGDEPPGDELPGDDPPGDEPQVPSDLYANGRTPTGADLRAWAEEQGWTLRQTETGPPKYFDENGVERLTIKSGSARTPGSEGPHISVRGPDGRPVDPETGDPVPRNSPRNHLPYTP